MNNMILNHEAHAYALKDMIAHAETDHPDFNQKELEKFIEYNRRTLISIEATIERAKMKTWDLLFDQIELWK